MDTEFTKALQWLNGRLKFGIKPGLERMNYMLEQLEHPERRLKVVHVAGTNGKGSTVSFMRHILQAAGYTVGTFTSPFIEAFNERISINGVPISDDDFVAIVNTVKPIVEKVEGTPYGAPTEFEVLTVIAIEYFAKVAVSDITIMETGLGGRLDSTNVVHPLLTIITNIGHDHMDVLGDTIEDIATEKAGIIKSGISVITAVEQKAALDVIKETCRQKRSKLYQLGKDFNYFDVNQEHETEKFSFTSAYNSISGLEISMKGKHQIKNSTVALMAIQYLKQYYFYHIEEDHIKSGLKNTFWIGRFEKMSQNPLIYVDGAHNPEGIDALCETIQRYYSNKKVKIIFCAMKDKALQQMVAKLDQIADTITFTQFEYPRCAFAADLYKLSTSAMKHMEANWQIAIENEIKIMKENEVLIITGSLYFISKVRQVIKNI
ncbi:bifunctional folylpolyglutamate synthase/dihydrofolate synthase [Calidifontibacillus oryziterrae]|uniref:bifunctional folylpolyglutamate synthase/dihydrofolate synthase n=1 Tax=Calidifontibacillus oryziterrae TaxID=1191699 RepID=UPI0002F0A48F|nr:folylpolyglutamate synthase/dihydrofolate synthase family protein [Calidifontibacillus oryziterrae]